MTKDERESIITQLALVQGVNRLMFDKYSDEQLTKELKKLYGEDEKCYFCGCVDPGTVMEKMQHRENGELIIISVCDNCVDEQVWKTK